MKRIFTILVLSAGLFLTWILWPGSGTDWVEIDVKEGMTAHAVAAELKSRGLLERPQPFLIWIKLRNLSSRIKVGRYRFSRGRSAWWLVDDVTNGRTQKVKLVIPEGFASWQIADRVGELNICDKNEFLRVVKERNLEGYLYPATYDLDVGYSPEAVAYVLTSRFDRVWTVEMEERAKAMGFTKKQIVTLASIIEREVVIPEEYPLVSSVYHNRLKKKMPLQADPTVQYAIGYWKQRLLYADYRNVKSPYNTYLNAGLPPGPICSPSVAALQAALSPAQTDYLYFVASEGGRHTFSVNYREHTNKVNKRNQLRGK